ncbi:MAG: SRPBCC domain-containing protein [Planctomycetota bacterium]
MSGLRTFLALISVVLLSGCSSQLQRDTVINAAPGTVWDVMSAFEQYPQWNPYHVYVEGRLEVGETLAVDVERPNGSTLTIQPTITKVVPGKEFVWESGSWWTLARRYSVRVVDVGRGRTRLLLRESFSGLAAPFTHLRAIGPGYKLINLAAQARAEAVTTP